MEANKVTFKIILHVDNIRVSPPPVKTVKKRKTSKGSRETKSVAREDRRHEDRESKMLDRLVADNEKFKAEQVKIEEEAKRKREAAQKVTEEARVKAEEARKAAEKHQKEAENAIITFKTIEAAFASERQAQIIMRTLSHEKEIPRAKLDEKWKKICAHFSECFRQKSNTGTTITGQDPEEFYKEILKETITSLFIKHATVLKKRRVFERFNPVTQPICMVSVQQRIATDMIPELSAFVPLKHLIDYGLIMSNIMTYHPEGRVPACYALFQSFHYSYNLAMVIFFDDDNHIGYQYATFDRFETTVVQ